MTKFNVLLILLAFTGCTTTRDSVLGTPQTQVQMRSYQSRAFDTEDENMVLRSLIATMQDLGFVIENADDKLKTVSGTSFANGSKLTATVRRVGKQTIVRVNADQGNGTITNPVTYQNFFNSLRQSLFLDANEIE